MGFRVTVRKEEWWGGRRKERRGDNNCLQAVWGKQWGSPTAKMLFREGLGRGEDRTQTSGLEKKKRF